MNDPYDRISKREVYRNRWLTVEVHEIVHPTGAPGEHVLVVGGAPSGVLVVEGDAFVFARQSRFGARARYIEIVKGGRDDGETALDCAKRELREEIGIEADSWTPLGVAYEIPSIMDAPVELFLATNVRIGETDQEHVEDVEPVRMPIDEAFRAAADGRIDDAVTLAAMLRYRLLTDGTGS